MPPVVERRLREKYGAPVPEAVAAAGAVKGGSGEAGERRAEARRARAARSRCRRPWPWRRRRGRSRRRACGSRLHGRRARPADARATSSTAGKAAIDAGRTKYAPAVGPARAARRRRRSATARTSRSSFAPEEVCVAVGGKQALALALPGHPRPRQRGRGPDARPGRRSPRRRASPAARRSSCTLHGEGRLPGHRARDRPKVGTPKTRAVIVNSPSNPTGAVIEPEELLKLARLAKQHGFWLLYDDTYAHLVVRDERPARAAGGEGRGRRPPGRRRHRVEELLHDRLAHRLGDGPEGARRGLRPRSTRTRSRARRRSRRSRPREALTAPQDDGASGWSAEYRRRRDFIHPAVAAIPGVTCPRAGGRLLRVPRRARCLSRDAARHARARRAAARGEGGGRRSRRGLPGARLLPALVRDGRSRTCRRARRGSRRSSPSTRRPRRER